MNKAQARRGLYIFLERAYFLDHIQREQFLNNLEALIKEIAQEEINNGGRKPATVAQPITPDQRQ